MMVMKVIDGYDLAGCRRDVDLSRACLAQPGSISDIRLRNDQNIPFNHLHHHHGTRGEQLASLAEAFCVGHAARRDEAPVLLGKQITRCRARP
jgi:hypothetical protein